ncbi:MAG: SGNH/GDSL hydrolase family protein [Pirellulales bacterium]
MSAAESTEPTRSAGVAGFLRFYRSCAVMLLNTLLLFCLFNLVLGIAFGLREAWKASKKSTVSTFFNADGSPVDNGKRNEYELHWFDYTACGDVPAQKMSEVLDDFDDLARLGFLYQPWVQFCERPHQGKWVSVVTDNIGFPMRRTLNPKTNKRNPPLRVYCLGGSTTFGYKVADEDTWPTYLSAALNQKALTQGLDQDVEVSNYGRGFYNSSQELVLLIDLLKSGHQPALIIFFDGVNEGGGLDVPHLTTQVGRSLKQAQTPDQRDTRPLPLVGHLPVMKLVDFIKSRTPRSEAEKPKKAGIGYDPDLLLRRYQLNRKLSTQICSEFGVKSLFFVQPAADYNYPVELYRLKLPDTFLEQKKNKKEFYDKLSKDKDSIYLGDLFEKWGAKRKAILDDCHYTPAFNRFVAEAVAARVDLSGLKATSNSVDPSRSTTTTRHPMIEQILSEPRR